MRMIIINIFQHCAILKDHFQTAEGYISKYHELHYTDE